MKHVNLTHEIYKNKAKGGFSLLAWATKPSETAVVHWSGYPSQYQSSLLSLNLSGETDTHHTTPQSMKVRRRKKSDS